jgi:hypothetical protein
MVATQVFSFLAVSYFFQSLRPYSDVETSSEAAAPATPNPPPAQRSDFDVRVGGQHDVFVLVLNVLLPPSQPSHLPKFPE